MAGWEQYFTVTWEAAQSKSEASAAGIRRQHVVLRRARCRILVETLDAAGETTLSVWPGSPER